MFCPHDPSGQPGITLRGRTVVGLYFAIGTLATIGLYHAIALLAFEPYFFEWWALAVLAVGVFPRFGRD